MAEPVTLEQIKANLRLDADVTDLDALLEMLITAARRSVELRTGRTIVGDAPTLTGDDLETAKQAISLLVGAWFANPEGVSADPRSVPKELPLGVGWIIQSLKRWDDGSC